MNPLHNASDIQMQVGVGVSDETLRDPVGCLTDRLFVYSTRILRPSNTFSNYICWYKPAGSVIFFTVDGSRPRLSHGHGQTQQSDQHRDMFSDEKNYVQ